MQNLIYNNGIHVHGTPQTSSSAWQFAATDTLQARQMQVNTGIQAALTSLQSDWSNLPDTAAWEINRKRLYAVWLKYDQGAGFTDSDYDVMRAIASECPLYGGMTVREIPMFLPDGEANDCTKEDYRATCIDTSQYREGQAIIAGLADQVLTVYPNPANNQVTLLVAASATPTVWTITDLTGRIWRQGTFPAYQTSRTVETAALPVGLYVASVRSKDGKTASVKFSIQR